MKDGPPKPIDAYTPFSHDEIKRLERYARRVHDLEQTALIREVEMLTFTLSGGDGKPTTATVSGVDDKMLKETLMELRPLWLQEESAGFDRVQAFVKRHAHAKGSDAGRTAIQHAKAHTQRLDQIMDGPMLVPIRERELDPMGNLLSEEDVKPRRVFEDFMHGVYFHEDEDRRERIGAWLPSELQRYVFINTVHDVAHVYRSFATLVEGILAEPSMRA